MRKSPRPRCLLSARYFRKLVHEGKQELALRALGVGLCAQKKEVVRCSWQDRIELTLPLVSEAGHGGGDYGSTAIKELLFWWVVGQAARSPFQRFHE